MRLGIVLLSFVALAVPAQAAPDRDLQKIQRALNDPSTAQRINRSIDGLTDVLMSLKVGALQAALEGREPTAADHEMTLGQIESHKGPQAEAELRAKIRAAGPAIAGGMNAIANALPAMSRVLEDMERAIDKAAANMPDPAYPKR